MGEAELLDFENRIQRAVRGHEQAQRLPAAFMEPRNQNELNRILRDRQFERENANASDSLLRNFKKAVSILLLAGAYTYLGASSESNTSDLILPAEYLKQLEAMAMPCSGLNGKTVCKFSVDDRLWAQGKLAEYKDILKKSVNKQTNRTAIKRSQNKIKKLRNNYYKKHETKRVAQPSRKGRGKKRCRRHSRKRFY